MSSRETVKQMILSGDTRMKSYFLNKNKNKKNTLTKNITATVPDAKENVCAHKYAPEKHANQEVGRSATFL